ncbi:uncharacterized protein [Brachionichthys hirsutus]|uniref:uncharacterized protein n=1 Tax=Brachionichthys hirsutus TaxID=412623 RepID=UPI003604EF13
MDFSNLFTRLPGSGEDARSSGPPAPTRRSNTAKIHVDQMRLPKKKRRHEARASRTGPASTPKPSRHGGSYRAPDRTPGERRGRTAARGGRHRSGETDCQRRCSRAMTQEFMDQNAFLVDGRLLCRHFLWGRCIKGDDCQLEHAQGSNDLIKELCKFYVQGHCMKGGRCPYMHNILKLHPLLLRQQLEMEREKACHEVRQKAEEACPEQPAKAGGSDAPEGFLRSPRFSFYNSAETEAPSAAGGGATHAEGAGVARPHGSPSADLEDVDPVCRYDLEPHKYDLEPHKYAFYCSNRNQYPKNKRVVNARNEARLSSVQVFAGPSSKVCPNRHLVSGDHRNRGGNEPGPPEAVLGGASSVNCGREDARVVSRPPRQTSASQHPKRFKSRVPGQTSAPQHPKRFKSRVPRQTSAPQHPKRFKSRVPGQTSAPQHPKRFKSRVPGQASDSQARSLAFSAAVPVEPSGSRIESDSTTERRCAPGETQSVPGGTAGRSDGSDPLKRAFNDPLCVTDELQPADTRPHQQSVQSSCPAPGPPPARPWLGLFAAPLPCIRSKPDYSQTRHRSGSRSRTTDLETRLSAPARAGPVLNAPRSPTRNSPHPFTSHTHEELPGVSPHKEGQSSRTASRAVSFQVYGDAAGLTGPPQKQHKG